MKNLILALLLIIPALLTLKSANASDFDDTKVLAEQGDAWRQFRLGWMYDNGKGVPENDAEAVKWYRKSADQGFRSAQFSLGRRYWSDDGVPENSIRAYMWLSTAESQGIIIAGHYLEKLKSQMTKQQIADGQALASKCFESGYKDCD
jgi:TPR repeat protein